jgi:hypothetical protein
MACKECSGTGTVERGGKLFNCECFYVKQATNRMPMHIRRADILPAHMALPIIQFIDRSLYVRGTYSDIKAVIKATILRHETKWIKLTSDAEIRNVYVGSMSKSSKSEDYVGDIYNNLQDLMDPPNLVIVHLNVISNKNKAAPGALEESLAHRINNDKPIWVFSTYESPFTQSSYAYSARVNEIIDSGFLPVDIPRINQADQHSLIARPEASIFEPEAAGTAWNTESKKSKKAKAARDDDIDPSLAAWGAGVKRKSKKPFGNGEN